MSVQNVCTNTIPEPGDMLCRMTGHFIGTAAGTPSINTYGTDLRKIKVRCVYFEIRIEREMIDFYYIRRFLCPK